MNALSALCTTPNCWPVVYLLKESVLPPVATQHTPVVTPNYPLLYACILKNTLMTLRMIPFHHTSALKGFSILLHLVIDFFFCTDQQGTSCTLQRTHGDSLSLAILCFQLSLGCQGSHLAPRCSNIDERSSGQTYFYYVCKRLTDHLGYYFFIETKGQGHLFEYLANAVIWDCVQIFSFSAVWARSWRSMAALEFNNEYRVGKMKKYTVECTRWFKAIKALEEDSKVSYAISWKDHLIIPSWYPVP